MAAEDPSGTAATALPSLRRNSMARLSGLAARLLIGTGSAIVTARLLGPAQKGALSTLLYIATLLSYACALGLGEAGTVLSGRGSVDRAHAVSASAPVVIVACIPGVGVLAGVAWMAEWSAIAPAVVVAAVMLPIAALSYLYRAFLNSLEELVLTSVTLVVGAVVALLVTVLLIGVVDLGVLGAVTGDAVGTAVMFVVFAAGLRSRGLGLRPASDVGYLRRALRFGVTFEAAHLLGALAERADLLLVYAIAGETSAGSYSVALTIGRLSVYASDAIAGASFPRLAVLAPSDARELIARAARLAFVAALVTGSVLAVAMPVVIPLGFGGAFAPAVTPAIILAAAGVLYGPQLSMASAAAARGRASIYFASFATTIVTMVVLDLALIPTWAATGAAIAAMASAASGLAAAGFALARADIIDLRSLLPRTADAVELFEIVRDSIRRARRRRRDTASPLR